MKPRFRAIHINRIWSIPGEDLQAIKDFPVGLLLRPSGWMIIGSRPCEVDVTMGMLRGGGWSSGRWHSASITRTERGPHGPFTRTTSFGKKSKKC